MAKTSLVKHESQTPTTAERVSQTPIFTPLVDIRESATEVVLVADMPGVDENSVDIALEGQELTITGRYVPEPPAGYSLSYQEFASGNYEREFIIGDVIDRNGIKATVKDGILRLSLPKAKEAQPRRIAVTAD